MKRKRPAGVELELARQLFSSIVEGMGNVLMRSAFSANIKERRDYSCALFDAAGRAVALGDHMPVHLGSMPAAVESVLSHRPPRGGEMVVVNDPFSGGTHLPDLTLVMAYPWTASRPRYYLANRAHHSDIGGAHPASMAPGSEEIFQEGLILPPVRLVRDGRVEPELLATILANVRTPREREADLRAQIAANLEGARRLEAIERRVGKQRVARWGAAQRAYGRRMVASFLAEIPDGIYRATEFLEEEGPIRRLVRLRVRVHARRGRIRVDFTGTDPQTRGNLNAVEAITRSAVFFVFRCLVREEIPFSSGCFEMLEIVIPPGSVLSARHPSAVAGGNVETSQRVVDLVLKALRPALPGRIPAQSCGTMTNLTLGTGIGEGFAYYETIAGGMGGSPSAAGLSAVHTAMTNSLNTPVEALEQSYPLRVVQYAVRRGSGGAGKHPGGDGVIREIQALGRVKASLLSERRRCAPAGAAGGRPGKAGRAWRVRGDRLFPLGGKVSLDLQPGDSLRVATPGGGGWGAPDKRRSAARKARPSAHRWS
jgi:N-methylhydantoinase B